MTIDDSYFVPVQPYYLRNRRSRLWHTVIGEHASGPLTVVEVSCNKLDAFKEDSEVSSFRPRPGKHCFNCYQSDKKAGRC